MVDALLFLALLMASACTSFGGESVTGGSATPEGTSADSGAADARPVESDAGTTPQNYALSGVATASSEHLSGSYPANNVNDGKPGTNWYAVRIVVVTSEASDPGIAEVEAYAQ